MELLPIVKALALVATANSAPVLARMILGARLATPLDGGAVLRDGRPLFGPAKTIRGIAAALAAAAAVAPVLGIDWTLGVLAGALAMAGDLLSSFLKRRLGFAVSTRAPGLDYIPESLIPLVVVGVELGLGAAGIFAATAAFWIGAAVLSPLLFRIGLRDRPH
jgi:CDP-2,3-bis-(O-geranylgeranyl)-sn-glycerol synthase